MDISKAKIEEYEEVRGFYHAMIEALEGAEYHPMWQKDIYPSPDDLKTALGEESLYVGREDGSIVAAMVVNQKCNAEYADAAWRSGAAPEEVSVIHMLGAHPAFAGKGLAKEMVRYALGLARQAGRKAVRLDVLKGNLPAEHLYAGLGFDFIQELQMFYEDTGWTEFKLYEYALTE